MNKKPNILIFAIAVLFTALVVYLLIDFVLIGIHKNDWKTHTTPLSKETIEYLCSKFELESTNALCNGRGDVFGPDFYDVILSTFKPYWNEDQDNQNAATLETVEAKIGRFMVGCESVVINSDGLSYYICDYDLRGDGVFILGIMFSFPENKVIRIYTPMGED